MFTFYTGGLPRVTCRLLPPADAQMNLTYGIGRLSTIRSRPFSFTRSFVISLKGSAVGCRSCQNYSWGRHGGGKIDVEVQNVSLPARKPAVRIQAHAIQLRLLHHCMSDLRRF